MSRKGTKRRSFFKGLIGGSIVAIVVLLIGINFWMSREKNVVLSGDTDQQALAQVTETPVPTEQPTKVPVTEQPELKQPETKQPATKQPTTQTPTPTAEVETTQQPTKEPLPTGILGMAEGVEFMGVSEAGKAYTYDATVIAKKLSKYEYKNNGKKIVFLTFDDGASTTVTPKILDVLRENDVKATFFVTGMNIKRGKDAAKKLVKQEFEEGHAIANHSYTHDYTKLYPEGKLNLRNFLTDFAKTDKMLKQILGKNFGTRVIRCPGGYMSWKNMGELSKYMKENNMASIDWNALSKDAEGKKKNAKQLYQNAVATAKGKEIVVMLMHDTYHKEETAKALPDIIKHFKERGYEFKTLS